MEAKSTPNPEGTFTSGTVGTLGVFFLERCIMEFHKKNHYIPQFYLKNWGRKNNKVNIYRLLVSHKNVPKFHEKSIKTIGFYDDLYTDYIDGSESDYMERWIDKKIESPAKLVIEKITKGSLLTQEDYKIISRFLVCQQIRTPAYLKRNINKWHQMMEKIMNDLRIPTYEEMLNLQNKESNKEIIDSNRNSLNVKLSFVESKIEGKSNMKIETHIGRKLWIFAMRRHLIHTVEKLPNYKWTIYQAPDNFYWPTSDNPVAVINYYNSKKYDFTGGWGFNGSEIFMPVSPKHIIYTQVGDKCPSYQTANLKLARLFKKLIIENADEFIILNANDKEVETYRKREVNQKLFNQNKKKWEAWLESQTELDMLYQKKTTPNTAVPDINFCH